MCEVQEFTADLSLEDRSMEFMSWREHSRRLMQFQSFKEDLNGSLQQ